MTTEGPRPEGLWRARVHGEFTVVDLVRETCPDGSYTEAVNCALAGYGWIEGDGGGRDPSGVQLLEPLDPSRPLGARDREAVRAALRARRPAAKAEEPAPGMAASQAPPEATMAEGVPHPSHNWNPRHEAGGGLPRPDFCTRCLALENEPPGWAPCRKADGAAKMAAVVAEVAASRNALTLAEPGTKVPLPPAGSHQMGALEQPGWSGLGCTLCGKRASAEGFDATPCPANP